MIIGKEKELLPFFIETPPELLWYALFYYSNMYSK
jgi:hypothetical protein